MPLRRKAKARQVMIAYLALTELDRHECLVPQACAALRPGLSYRGPSDLEGKGHDLPGPSALRPQKDRAARTEAPTPRNRVKNL